MLGNDELCFLWTCMQVDDPAYNYSYSTCAAKGDQYDDARSLTEKLLVFVFLVSLSDVI